MNFLGRKYRILHVVIILYLVAAFTWWAILLFQKNEEIYQLQIQLSQYISTIDMEMALSEFNKQKMMIVGEGLVFALSILISMFLINRAFISEIETNKQLNNFLLSVTHELKTPIASLKMINRTLYNKNIEEADKIELLETAYEESTRLESLVNNILTAAQMEHRYKYNFEKIDLGQLVQQSVSRFQKSFLANEISFTSQEGLTINADKEALIKVIDNLIDNGIKYAPKNSILKIETGRHQDFISVKFIDSGRGIKAQEKKKILKKFYRIGNEETREKSGAGLGLFIVKETLDAHHGDLLIFDNTPAGSIFEIRLPMSK